MKYAILGDIHGNLEALNEVIKDARKNNVEQFLCVGDVVGYGADPSACIGKVQELDCLTVAGNHDHAVCDKTDISSFNEFARMAVLWTKSALSEDDIAYLEGLNYIHSFDSFSLVHSSFVSPEKWGYVFTLKDAFLNFKFQPTDIAFIGHSHVPGIFVYYDGIVRYLEPVLVNLSKGVRFLINVGSVGQPRDNNPLSSYVIFDEQIRTLEFRRIKYNIKKTQKKIFSAGLPEILATRLEWGK